MPAWMAHLASSCGGEMAKADITDEQRRRGGFQVFDYETTVVHIVAAGKDVESSFDAVHIWAENYPNARGLKQFAEIEIRLRILAEKVKATGSQQVR